MRQATTVDRLLFEGKKRIITVFTDRPDDARDHGNHLSRVELKVIEIPSIGWPDATLLRYRVFADHWDEIRGDVIMYLDADMLVASQCGSELKPESWINGVALVQHPGYYRGQRPWILRLRHPRLIVTDLAALIRNEGGTGQWEKSRASQAFVPLELRREYVCGGTWMGTRPVIKDLVNELAERTDIDTSAGVIARWHDESHLNWWAATHPHSTLGPEYCHDPGASHLQGIAPRIVAVVKKTEKH